MLDFLRSSGLADDDRPEEVRVDSAVGFDCGGVWHFMGLRAREVIGTELPYLEGLWLWKLSCLNWDLGYSSI